MPKQPAEVEQAARASGERPPSSSLPVRLPPLPCKLSRQANEDDGKVGLVPRSEALRKPRACPVRSSLLARWQRLGWCQAVSHTAPPRRCFPEAFVLILQLCCKKVISSWLKFTVVCIFESTNFPLRRQGLRRWRRTRVDAAAAPLQRKGVDQRYTLRLAACSCEVWDIYVSKESVCCIVESVCCP